MISLPHIRISEKTINFNDKKSIKKTFTIIKSNLR